jgi:hypothetical protein
LQLAIVNSVLIAYLFLPVKTNINLPLLPLMDKNTIPVLTILLCAIFLPKLRFKIFNHCKLSNLFVLMILVTPIFTMLKNREPVIYESIFIPGYSYYETVSLILFQFLAVAMFFVGRNHFKKFEFQNILLQAIAFWGGIYTVFVIFELIFSPQLHIKIYGFFPHDYIQMLRDGGYRPVVFLGHGLTVSFFLAAATLVSALLWKKKESILLPFASVSTKTMTFYLLIIVFISKSLAPFLFALFSVLCSVFFKSHKILLAALIISFIALSYPLTKMIDIFPSEQLVSMAENFTSAERADSLAFRFKNENTLLDKAKEKLLVGWGGWGRALVYDSYGQSAAITDGYWILLLGRTGLIGFIGVFGLIFYSVYKARIASKYISNAKEKHTLALHALLVALILINQLPNASLDPFWWLVIGVLMGRSEQLLEIQKADNKTPNELIVQNRKVA